MKFRIAPSRDGQWVALLVGQNGRVVMTSETYRRKSGATRAVKSIARAFGLRHFTVEIVRG